MPARAGTHTQTHTHTPSRWAALGDKTNNLLLHRVTFQTFQRYTTYTVAFCGMYTTAFALWMSLSSIPLFTVYILFTI